MFQPQPTPYAAASSAVFSAPYLAPTEPDQHHHHHHGHGHDQSHDSHHHQGHNQPHDHDQSHAFGFPAAALGVSGGSPLVFDHSIFSPAAAAAAAASFRSGPVPFNLIHPPHRYHAMHTPPADDLAAQEALARGYQPELKGPLVGEKRSSRAIAEEYAKADPVYVAKTAALPNTYTHFRPIKGDGNCGWRAIGFSYFETLLRLGDKKLVQEESARMLSHTDFVVNMCGHELWIFEDMRDECLNLLREIEEGVPLGPQPDASAWLLERFNIAEVSDAIIYWFRLLASAYMRSHAASFQDFIPELIGVESYCKDVLEPVNNEIDHLGVTLLVNVLLVPISVDVEIVYLDRSEGSQVNSHTFGRDGGSPPRDAIYLLYRPGHYDILYKDLPVPRAPSLSPQQVLEGATAAQANLQVHRATSFTQRQSFHTSAEFSGVDMSLLANMPAMFGALSPSHPFAEPYSSVSSFSPAPTHAPPYSIDSVRTSHSISPPSSVSTPTVYATPTTTLPIHPPHVHHVQTPHSLPISPEPLSPGPLSPTRSLTLPNGIPSSISGASPGSLPGPNGATSQFRPSMYQYKEDWGDGPAQGFQTSTFKNSHYNVSHYNNPNFQPEQWTPECEEAMGSGGGLKRRGTG